MKQDKNTFSFVNIGLSSLLVVFLVLCLTTFALLSLSSAKSDYSLSRNIAEHRTNYYSASYKAEEILAHLDDVMDETYKAAGTENYISSLIQALKSETLITFYEENGSYFIFYQIPSSDSQVLSVKLQITDPSEHDNYYEIL
ncbi:MAG: hypothetical protein ACOCNL_13245, partial [Acetivibrio ethanolgignens]